MRGAEAQCTVPGGKVVSGMVVQVVACDSEDYHAVAIEGATPLMPLSWLLLLAGWKYLPEVDKGKIRVVVRIAGRQRGRADRKVKDALHGPRNLSGQLWLTSGSEMVPAVA